MATRDCSNPPVLPFGIDDLDPRLQWRPNSKAELRCVVRDCSNFVRPSSQACPQHGIRSHPKGTYSYADAQRNVIIDSEVFQQHIVESTSKQSCRGLGNENSEDSLVWNVFRSLQSAGCLGKIANLIFGVPSSDEPQLFFWGLTASDDSFAMWDLLTIARQRFETDIQPPSKFTEPDIVLHLPGKYLLVIEAKFTSPNSILPLGWKQKQIIKLYNFPALATLNPDTAKFCGQFCDQLWRNMVFTEWIANQQSDGTEPFLVNLVRDGFEVDGALAFSSIMNEEQKHRFRRVTWEQLFEAIPVGSPMLSLLRTYMTKKSADLRRAFRLPA